MSKDIQVLPLRCSVVIPSFNRLNVLPRAVESVLAQDEPDFELIVVDDGSSDGTKAWLAAQTNSRLRHASERDAASAPRVIFGLAAARAPVVAFLDSDDAYRPQRLRRVLQVMDAEPDVVCTLSSSIKQFWDENRTNLVPDVKLAPAAFEWALFCDLIGVDGSGITVRTQAARDVGGFCEKLRRTEDREFLIRLAPRGAARLCCPTCCGKNPRPWIANPTNGKAPGATSSPISRSDRNTPRAFANWRAIMPPRDYCRRSAPARSEHLLGDLKSFRRIGLLHGGLARIWRDHREVRHYRRTMSNRDALAQLAGAPAEWA